MVAHQYNGNIIVFRIGSLGDTLVALPAFHLLRKQYPQSKIILLTNTPVDGGIKAAASHQILMGSGLVDQFIEYPHGRFSLPALMRVISEIRKLKPQEVVYLMPRRTKLQRFRDALFFFIAGIWRVRGLFVAESANTHHKVPGGEYYESEASRLIRSVGFDSNGLDQSLFSLVLQENERDTAKKILADISIPFIAISVGAKVPAKDWGSDRWFDLLKKLAGSLPNSYALVCFGSKDEFERCESITSEWSGPVLNLCGALSPRESAAVLERAAIYVGHDSGPMHLASSVGIPCISIFAARDKPGVWFPYGNEENVFYRNVPCSNCKLSVCTEHQMICIYSIEPEEVAERIHQLLSAKL